MKRQKDFVVQVSSVFQNGLENIDLPVPCSKGAAASTDHQSDSELSEASDDDDYVMITSLKGQQCSFKSRLYIDYPFLEYLVQKNAVFWFPCRFFFLLRIQLKPHSP